MDNVQIAHSLEVTGHLLDILGENPFKIRAYHAAARTIEGLEFPVQSLAREGRLREIPGIGEGLAKHIEELVKTGQCSYFEQIRQQVPSGLLQLLRIPTLGAKKIRALWHELKIDGIESLKVACSEGKVSKLKGFGEKTQAKIIEGIAVAASHIGMYRLDEAIPVARRVLAYVASSPAVLRSSLAGSIRRWRETVHDIDILASSEHPEQAIDHFIHVDGVESVLGRGPTKASLRLVGGMQVDLRVVNDDEFAPALVYFTGSKDHNVLLRSRALKMGMTVNEYGIYRDDKRINVATEEEFYKTLKLQYVPPELREARGEIEAAEVGALPRLVTLSDLQGVFHVHSRWSDGRSEIAEMAEKARKLGLTYMGLSDHSKAAGYAGGLSEERLRRQMEEVRELNRRWSDFRILHGLECDILPDGSLDLNPTILGELDFVIGSIHSRFDMAEGEMTDRICKALHNKDLDILGHPTGRLLLHRAGYRVNLERVMEEALRARKVIECNANPNRLDLDWVHLKRAREMGIAVSINPDAHSLQGLEDIEYGIATARRGWLEAKHVLNTRSAEEALRVLHHGA